MGFIPYGRQTVTEDDIKAVVEVLRSDYLTQGQVGLDFEAGAAKFLHAPYALSCNSATSGLYMAYAALGFGKGDVLWTVPITFVATSNMALALGGEVDFVDIDPQTFCLGIKALEEKLKAAKTKGRLPKIVAPVHFAGQPCDMQALRKLSDEYGFFIVEDASHAFGATYNGSSIGACEFCDIAVFSFHPVKIITTGEGGLVTTRKKDLADKMAAVKSHGVTKDAGVFTKPADGPWVYEQQSLGFNFRMTDFQAALGLSQMKGIEQNIKRRRQVAATYHEQLKGLPIKWQLPIAGADSSWHLFVVTCDDNSQRLGLFNHLRANNIGAQVHYIPVHTQPYYRSLGFVPGMFPCAEDYYSRCVSIPMYHGLKPEEQEYVIKTIRSFF